MPDGNNTVRAKPGSRLRELGLVLPKPPTPLRACIEVNQVGSLLFLSGTIPVVNRKLAFTGRLRSLRSGNRSGRESTAGVAADHRRAAGSPIDAP